MNFLVVQLACILLLAVYLVFFCRHKMYWYLAVGVYSASSVLTGGYLLADTFTGAGITESVLFHLLYGLAGVDLYKFSIYILVVVVFGLAWLISLIAFWRMFQRRKRTVSRYKVVELVVLSGLSLFALVLHPGALQSAQIVSDMMVRAEISLDDELSSFDVQRVVGQSRKNLVYIYVESLEGIFLNESGRLQELSATRSLN